MSDNSGRRAPMDRRTARTRTSLAQALIALGPERGVDALRVGELARRAGIGRSTFYGHYASKSDFLATSFVGMVTACEAAEAQACPDRPDVLPAATIFTHVEQSRAFALAIQRSHEFPHMLAAGEVRLRRIAEANLERRLPDMEPEQRREAAVFLAGGFMGLLRWWMEDGLRRSAAHMRAAYEALALRVLAETPSNDRR